MVRISRARRTPSTPSPDEEPQVSAPNTLAETSAAPVPPWPTEAPPSAAVGPVETLGLVLRAAHPRLGLATAAALSLAALLAGRPPREIAVVAATVVVGQAILGWHNDLVDRLRDQQHGLTGKPLADGRVEPGTVWFALACAVLLLVPLTVTNGITAGTVYLLSVLTGVVGNVVLRTGLLSFLPWAVSHALLPAFVSYGGYGGQFEGDPPRIALVALAALAGIGVHLLVSVWGLEPDDADGWRTVPLRLGRRFGSSRLLLVSVVWLGAVGAGIAVVAADGGLSP